MHTSESVWATPISNGMNHNIKGTHVEVTPELRSYVEKKLAHADKFLASDSVAHADVELEHAPLRDGDRYRAEFTIEASGGLYRSEAWGPTLHEAIDSATQQVARELRRSKRKRLHVLRHSAMKVKEFLRGWRNRL